MTPEEKARTPDNMDTTMRYADRSMKAFFERIQGEPWFSNTLFFITADHGFNGEKRASSALALLHRPSTWIPWWSWVTTQLRNLPRLDPTLSSHVDLTPTILDLLGIKRLAHLWVTACWTKRIEKPLMSSRAMEMKSHGRARRNASSGPSGQTPRKWRGAVPSRRFLHGPSTGPHPRP